MNGRPNAITSAVPEASAASARSRLKSPARIRVPGKAALHLAHETRRHGARRCDQVQVADLARSQRANLLKRFRCLAFIVGGQVVERVERRQAHANPFGADRRGDGIDHFEQEATAVFSGAAVLVLAHVAARIEELRQQITVGRMQLHAIHARGDRQPGGMHVSVADADQVLCIHGLGLAVVLHALAVGPHLAGGRDGRRADQLAAFGQIECMADAAGVHQLHDQSRADRVHGIGDITPAVGLRLVEQAGDARVAKALGRRRGAFGDDQSGAAALEVVVAHDRVGNISDRARAGHRRHRDAIFQRQRACCGRLEQGRGFGHEESPGCCTQDGSNRPQAKPRHRDAALRSLERAGSTRQAAGCRRLRQLRQTSASARNREAFVTRSMRKSRPQISTLRYS